MHALDRRTADRKRLWRSLRQRLAERHLDAEAVARGAGGDELGAVFVGRELAVDLARRAAARVGCGGPVSGDTRRPGGVFALQARVLAAPTRGVGQRVDDGALIAQHDGVAGVVERAPHRLLHERDAGEDGGERCAVFHDHGVAAGREDRGRVGDGSVVADGVVERKVREVERLVGAVEQLDELAGVVVSGLVVEKLVDHDLARLWRGAVAKAERDGAAGERVARAVGHARGRQRVAPDAGQG